ncbi:MAG: ribonuclease III [Prevotellaceae bacterium]|nr:ribonuclease III [Prevotellaceae bacterium]
MSVKDLISIAKFPFRKERELCRLLRPILGFYPCDIRPYQQALLHKSSSVIGEGGRKLNNERLEFLGDAILGSVVADVVYRHFEGKPEGFLTNTRSKIVQRESLNRVAHEMGLDRLVKRDEHISSSHNSYISGNAFEALVGAIYLDRGYARCLSFMKTRVLRRLINLDMIAFREQNFKSRLIEWTQKHKLSIDFRLVEEQKEEGNTPTFLTNAIIEGIVCGVGKGYSKKESHQLASRDALTRIKREDGIFRSIQQAKERRLGAPGAEGAGKEAPSDEVSK